MVIDEDGIDGTPGDGRNDELDSNDQVNLANDDDDAAVLRNSSSAMSRSSGAVQDFAGVNVKVSRNRDGHDVTNDVLVPSVSFSDSPALAGKGSSLCGGKNEH
jgi:hypothetical protein